jgi:uncharacterized protein
MPGAARSSSYVYLPKLRDRVVLATAIRDAVAKLDPAFGNADSFDEAVGTYSGLVWAKAPPVVMPASALLVRSEVVLDYLRRTDPGAVVGAEPAVDVTKPGAPPMGDSSPAARAGVDRPRRFYGSVEIDMVRPVKSFDAILNAVVMELQRTPGAKVKMTLDIAAEAPKGLPKTWASCATTHDS